MQQHTICTGLVLRAWGGTLSLLSPEEGRVEKKWYKTAHRSFVHRGSVVSYLPVKQGMSQMVEQLDLEKCATQLGFQDIYLLHYLLEVCYFFIPVGSEAREAYEYLLGLFTHFNVFACPVHKKNVVAKLFALLGVVPDDSAIQLLAYRLRQMPIDNLIDGTLELNTEELMNQWLAWCKDMHPKGKFFKAMPLLLEK